MTIHWQELFTPLAVYCLQHHSTYSLTTSPIIRDDLCPFQVIFCFHSAHLLFYKLIFQLRTFSCRYIITYKGNTSRPNIGSVHTSSTHTLIKFKELFSFFKLPEKRCNATHIKNSSPNRHYVIHDSSEFTKQH